MINTCVLVGRIASDPEMRYAPSGTAITKFRLAVERRRRAEGEQDQTDFLDIVAFGKSAEFIAQYLDKGARVGVEGRIQSRTWEGQDGRRNYAVEIVANTVQALETRAESEARRGRSGGPSGAPAAGPAMDHGDAFGGGDPFADE